MKNDPWFSQKKFGYGWGLPNNWKGWVTLLTYIFIIIISTIVYSPENSEQSFSESIPWLSIILISSIILFIICIKTSGKPKWRWGDKD